MTKSVDQNPKSSAAKTLAAARAVEMIQSGMKLGIGTGSTAAAAIQILGRRIREEGLEVVGVPTSYSSEALCRDAGVRTVSLDDAPELDLAFDGADEVDPSLNLIKGRGAAMTRERVVADAAIRFVVMVDETKLVDRLGVSVPVPVEILPMAAPTVRRHLQRLGGDAEIRMGARKDGPVVTDQGFWILDARFDEIAAPALLSQTIAQIPGVLGHGLFVAMAHDVLVGRADGTVDHKNRMTKKKAAPGGDGPFR